MSVTINSQILGQEFSSIASYCYLYEPLRVVISEDDLAAQKFYIDLEVIDTSDNTSVIETLFRYGDFDINPGNSISVDLMKIARQRHDANVYKYSHIDDIVEDSIGWNSVVSKYIYNFKIYSDINQTPISVKKIPIIGGRALKDFVPAVSQLTSITEYAQYGLTDSGRWIGYPYIKYLLKDPTAQDASPNLGKSISITGKTPCGGMLLWKSRLGGWITWGMDIKTESQKHSYENNLEVGMFDSTLEIDGSPFVPVDYTGIETSYSISLKALSLTSDELKIASGINSSPAIYYMEDSSGRLELMRLSSASAPVSTLANGGDFSVSLSSISRTSQKAR